MRGNMKAERARRGMTAKEVARQIGVHSNSVLSWESGESEPVADNLQKLARLYGCSIEYLLDQTNDRNGRSVSALK